MIILAVAAALFVSGKVRSDLVAICSLLALLICQTLTPAEGLAGFANSTVIMMVGLFVVGGGIFQTGLANMISSKIMPLQGRLAPRSEGKARAELRQQSGTTHGSHTCI